MNYRYGLEVECFYTEDLNTIKIPPKGWPVDGFPGLVELRTTGHHTLEGAFSSLYEEMLSYSHINMFFAYEHEFSPTEKRELRKRSWVKDICDVQSLYQKKPRNLRGKTIASFQINISNLFSSGYKDDKGVSHPDRFSLLDIPRIIRNLDQTFAKAIKDTKRQPGEYCVKEHRLEYRSLPNTIYSLNDTRELIQKIRKAVEG